MRYRGISIVTGVREDVEDQVKWKVRTRVADSISLGERGDGDDDNDDDGNLIEVFLKYLTEFGSVFRRRRITSSISVPSSSITRSGTRRPFAPFTPLSGIVFLTQIERTHKLTYNYNIIYLHIM